MAIITRLSRLFQADFHAVLDRIEEPDIQLKQAVREMEFDLQQDEQTFALMQHEAGQLLSAIDVKKSKITGFDEEMDICFAANKDDLARDLIRRKLEAQDALSNAEKNLENLDNQLEKLQQRISDHHSQLDNMKQKLELLVDSKVTTHQYANHATIRSEDIEIAFLREKQKRVTS